jgi:hypothetical protein
MHRDIRLACQHDVSSLHERRPQIRSSEILPKIVRSSVDSCFGTSLVVRRSGLLKPLVAGAYSLSRGSVELTGPAYAAVRRDRKGRPWLQQILDPVIHGPRDF